MCVAAAESDRPSDMSDLSWEYGYRIPLLLDQDDVDSIAIAVRGNLLSELEGGSLDDQQLELTVRLEFVKSANVALE